MTAVFTVDYDDGKVKAKAGEVVPDSIPSYRLGVLLKAKMAVVPDAPVVETPEATLVPTVTKVRRRRK